jgi:hypothetical protein
MKSKETYLGDGLYACCDGDMIWLRAPREGIDHVVALEPAVYHALVDYAGQVFAGEIEGGSQ